MNNRYLLLDALRGLAVLLMLVFHLAVDLEDFFGYNIGYRYGFWYLLNQIIVIIFLVVAGYSVGSGINRHLWKNGFKLLVAAFLVSLATYFFDKTTYIRFGILHFLACAMFLSPALGKLNNYLLLGLSLVLIFFGSYLQGISISTSLLLPFGITPNGFQSLDYYPLLPWLSVFIWGLLAGRSLKLPDTDYDSDFARGFAFVGRHALVIYLVHQPLFLLSLTLVIG